MEEVLEIKQKIKQYDEQAEAMLKSKETSRFDVMKIFTDICLLTVKINFTVKELLKSNQGEKFEEAMELKCSIEKLATKYEILAR